MKIFIPSLTDIIMKIKLVKVEFNEMLFKKKIKFMG